MLAGDLGLSLLASVNYVELGKDIVELLDIFLSTPVVTGTNLPSSKTILIQALSLLLKVLLVYRSDLYENIAQTYNIPQLLLKGLSYEFSPVVRDTIQELVYFISMNVNTIDKLPLIHILTPLLDSKVLFNPKCATEQLYELIIILLNKCPYNNTFAINTAEKFNEIMNYFVSYESIEVSQSGLTDIILLGLLRLAGRLLFTFNFGKALSSEVMLGFVQQIFYGGLFPDAKGNFKCKSARSRWAAYELLIYLSCFNNNFSMEPTSPDNLIYLIKDCILPLREKVTTLNTWAYNPANNERSHLGYTGLKNICCICYINSMLQQFYMISPFRNTILSIKDNKPPNYAENGIDDNLLHQFQRTFVYLMHSARKDYVPVSFCYSFKEFDGQPTNTAIQHDALEFINILFERLEENFKGTPYEQLLQSVFGGKSCSQVLCGNCGCVSSTYEDYYTLSLEIKNQRNLDDSLERFIAESTVSDYFCNNCLNRGDVTKRTIISTLPNVLIIHLQRFSFNFDTLMNEKIHTRLEFPNILDMTSYTEEGHKSKKQESTVQSEASPVQNVSDTREMEVEENEKEKEMKEDKPMQEASPKKPLKEKEYYTFKLVGVVMHNGNAEAGHYYSYINTNRRKNEEDKNYLRPELDHWLEFNDSIISNFTFSKLESECFGGTMEEIPMGYGDENSEVAKLIGGRSKSAYILLYERQKKESIPLKLDALKKGEMSMSLECDGTAISRTDATKANNMEVDNSFTYFDFHSVPTTITSELLAVLFY